MNWPPIIEAGAVPRWVALRDAVLTVGVWCVLLVLARDIGTMVVYWLTVAFGGVTPTPPWSPGNLAHEVRPYLPLVAVLIAWLVLFALIGLRRLVRVGPAPRDAELLDAVEHRMRFGIDAVTHERLLEAHVSTVILETADARPRVRLGVDDRVR